jgi:small GTP-binding protein
MCDDSGKVIFVGNAGVGKTSIIRQLMAEPWSELWRPTIEMSRFTLPVNVEGNIVDLDIWDTAGQEQYYAVSKFMYRDATVALIVFDVSDESSAEALWIWKNHVESVANPPPVFFYVGNKVDLPQAYSTEKYPFLQESNCILVSAKTGDGIRELTTSVAKAVFERGAHSNAENFLDVVPNTSEKQCCS